MTDDATPQPHRYYINRASTRLDRLDLTLDLGWYVVGDEEIDWTASVTMSWEEARIVERLLSEALRQYEQIVGPVRDVERAAQAFTDISQNGGGDGSPEQEPDTGTGFDPEPGT